MWSVIQVGLISVHRFRCVYCYDLPVNLELGIGVRGVECRIHDWVHDEVEGVPCMEVRTVLPVSSASSSGLKLPLIEMLLPRPSCL